MIRFFLLLFFAGLPVVLAESSLKRIDDDHFQIVFDHEKEISFLQVTDLHLGKNRFWKQDLATCARIRALVLEHNPDFIAVTGDLFTGEKPFGSLLAAFAVQFFDSLERPWIYVFGNHDPEDGFGRDQIYEIFSSSKWAVLGFHANMDSSARKYDYKVELLSAQSERPVWEVYAFDSGSRPGFKSIKADQILWYREQSKAAARLAGGKIPAIAFFHIPLKQYQDLWDDASIPKQGESREKVYFEEDDGSVYDAFVQVGNIRATFCGHDHYNNYWGIYNGGIILAYGHISGESTKYAWPTGGKLVRLPANGVQIQMRNVAPAVELAQ